MSPPEVKLGAVANLWTRQMHFINAGDTEPEHDHCFDHLTLLATGSVSVVVDGVTSEFCAPQMIYIKAGKLHTITALEANTLAYCIHALRDKAGELLDPELLPEGGNPMAVAHPLVAQ
jgi:glyoxylate utilization-related uncharacterized protein